jgi:hypothetical protein
MFQYGAATPRPVMSKPESGLQGKPGLQSVYKRIHPRLIISDKTSMAGPNSQALATTNYENNWNVLRFRIIFW